MKFLFLRGPAAWSSFVVVSMVLVCRWYGELPVALAQSSLPPPPSPTPLSYIDERTWLTAPWTADDKPFVQIEHQVDQIIRQGRKPEELRLLYKQQALADLTNEQNLYRWGYATFKTVRPMDAVLGKLDEKKWRSMFEAMNRPLAPEQYIYSQPKYANLYRDRKLRPLRSYRYSRLIFLIWSNGWIHWVHDSLPRDMARLGDRLLRRNPKDELVKTYCVSANRGEWTDGSGRGKPIDYPKALRYAQELVRDHPQNYDYLLVLATAQGNMWQYKKNDLGANQVIATLERYLKVAPPTAHYRKYAQYRIRLLKDDKKFWANWRKKHHVQ